MPANTQNLRMGTCQVFLNEVDLGHTLGGVKIEFIREFENMLTDKYGSAPVDKVFVGHQLKVTCQLAEPVESILTKVMPEGSYTIVGSDDKLGFGKAVGELMSQYARLLRLHPVKNPASDRSEDFYLFKAVSIESIELEWKVKDQTVFNTVFEALVDETQPNGTLLGRIGDQDVS